MTTSIIVHYIDQDGILTRHSIATDNRSLMYDDPFIEPIEVRNIAKRGLVIGRTNGIWPDGTPKITRSGVYVPPHRITAIDFADDYTE